MVIKETQNKLLEEALLPQLNNNNKIIDLPISPINKNDKEIKLKSKKNEPFGDLSGIIKKNILSHVKKNKRPLNPYPKKLNLNINKYDTNASKIKNIGEKYNNNKELVNYY